MVEYSLYRYITFCCLLWDTIDYIVNLEQMLTMNFQLNSYITIGIAMGVRPPIQSGTGHGICANLSSNWGVIWNRGECTKAESSFKQPFFARYNFSPENVDVPGNPGHSTAYHYHDSNTTMINWKSSESTNLQNVKWAVFFLKQVTHDIHNAQSKVYQISGLHMSHDTLCCNDLHCNTM